MLGVVGLHGQHVALLVALEQKIESEQSLLTKQMVELLVAGIALKRLNCLAELVRLVIFNNFTFDFILGNIQNVNKT